VLKQGVDKYFYYKVLILACSDAVFSNTKMGLHVRHFSHVAALTELLV